MITNILLTGSYVLLLIIFAGVVVHAPVTVYLQSSFGVSDVIKAWKEILLLPLVLSTVAVVILKREWRVVLGDWLVRIGLAYLCLHVLIAVVNPTGTTQLQAGLLIDARYVVFFLIVYVLSRFYSSRRYLDIALGLGSVIVVGFGLLQVTVLPKDILASIGYGASTIQPYLTVDQNHDYIRINSTLRGPNPLGLYVVGLMSILISLLIARWRHQQALIKWQLFIMIFAASVVLWHTYSRSALLALAISLVILGVTSIPRQVLTKRRIAISVASFIACVLLLVPIKNVDFVQQVVFHTDPSDTNSVNSDTQHAASVDAALRSIAQHPLGTGIGTTGSASLYGRHPFIIESQYLFVAHEVGIFGLMLFVSLWAIVLYRLYKERHYFLAKGLFVAGVGIAIAGLVLPVWADDTVSLLWWGLAARALQDRVKDTSKND